MNLLIPTKKTFYIHSTYLIQYFYTSIMALCSFLRACLIHKMHRMCFFSPFNMKLKRCISWARFNCLLLLFFFFLFVCSLCNSRVQVTKKIIMWIQKTHSWSSGYIFVNVVLNYFFLTPLHLELLFRQLMTMCAFYLSYSFLSSFPLEIKV